MDNFEQTLSHVVSLENHLGPINGSSPVNWNQILLDDEQESLPYSSITYVNDWGYADYLIPVHLGGKLNSFMDIYLLNRCLARRDITLAVAMGLTLFAATPIWISGSSSQQKDLCERIRKGEIGALALTEEEHGSDLMANEMRAQANSQGWEISGRKWCVNFASLGQTAVVLCRTHERGGVFGFSLFFLDKAVLNSTFISSPKLLTHGVRGLDISGFILNKVQVNNEALIGKEQQGLEITHKIFQISRTLCACLSVGGADSALRMAVSFSLHRQLYGKPAFEISAVKQRLGEQFVQLLIADCASLVVSRACTLMPEKLSFWSAIIKFLIPKIGEDIVEQCAIILGARAYLRTTEWALFQKIKRDIQVVGLFDGSSQVNLSLIAGNLLPQVGMRGSQSQEDDSLLKALFNMHSSIPGVEKINLRLFTPIEDSIVAGAIKLQSKTIQPLIDSLKEAISNLDKEVLILKEQSGFDPRSLAAFRLAEKYCWIFAISCCLLYWHHNQEILSDELKNTDWLNLAFQLMRNKIKGNNSIEPVLQEKMAENLCSYYHQKKLFSVISMGVA